MPDETPPARLTSQLVIRVTAEEADELARRAAAEDRPVASFVRHVLRQHIASNGGPRVDAA